MGRADHSPEEQGPLLWTALRGSEDTICPRPWQEAAFPCASHGNEELAKGPCRLLFLLPAPNHTPGTWDPGISCTNGAQPTSASSLLWFSPRAPSRLHSEGVHSGPGMVRVWVQGGGGTRCRLAGVSSRGPCRVVGSRGGSLR